jgi:hypothetical protein
MASDTLGSEDRLDVTLIGNGFGLNSAANQ